MAARGQIFGVTPPLPPITAETTAPLPGKRPPQIQGKTVPILAGDMVSLNGAELPSPWRLQGEPGASQGLFIPIEILTHQLGMQVEHETDGLRLIWFGHVFSVQTADPPLENELAVDIAPLVERFRWQWETTGSQLSLQVPPPRLINVRMGQFAERVRIVLDFLGPAPFRLQDGELLVEMRSRDVHLREMETLGIPHLWTDGLLRLNTTALSPNSRILTLGSPERFVLDLSYEDFLALRVLGPTKQGVVSPLKGLGLTTKVMSLGERRFRLHSVALDLAHPSITLLPLTRMEGMDALNSLHDLARAWQADLAINGGYFNRIRKLPLGALKREGHWYSGPILGRGAMGWGVEERPIFGRLAMEETVTGPKGSFPLTHLNSGYVQKGVARYTHHWDDHYHPLTENETGVLIQENRVVRHFAPFQLKGGVPLEPGTWLLVARAGASLPLGLGDSVSLSGRLTPEAFSRQTHILGGGPLLLLGGRQVLNGGMEGFSASFQREKAPRSVVAWGQDQLWLLTIQGLGHHGPTLKETAQLVQQLGMEDALNLDGGSSTTLVFQGVTAVRGRGVGSRVHNGLGVVIRHPQGDSGSQSRN